MSEYMLSTWMERLLELIKDYEPANIWNMDETGRFCKAQPQKGLAEKTVSKRT